MHITTAWLAALLSRYLLLIFIYFTAIIIVGCWTYCLIAYARHGRTYDVVLWRPFSFPLWPCFPFIACQLVILCRLWILVLLLEVVWWLKGVLEALLLALLQLLQLMDVNVLWLSLMMLLLRRYMPNCVCISSCTAVNRSACLVFCALDYFFQVSILSQTEQAWALLSQLFFSIEAFFMIELGHVYDHRGLAWA